MPLHHFYAKWVDPGTAFDPVTHAVNDVGVFSFSLSQGENDFAMLSLVTQNPQIGLLNPSRKQWLWFSWQEDEDTVTPLFFGRVVAVPEDITQVRMGMIFRARPLGFRETKDAFAETLKVAPHYDPIWVPADQIDNPDVVLHARSAKWHVDRVTHALTISDNIVGEDGTLTFDPADILAGSVSVRYSGAAASTVKVKAEIRWTQSATGVVDVTPNILKAFADQMGGNTRMIGSYTGGVFTSNWPLPGDNFGGGWTVADSSIKIGNGRWVGLDTDTANALAIRYSITNPDFSGVTSVLATFTLWVLKPTLLLRYEAARQRSEIVEFEVSSDVQALLSDTPDTDDPDDSDPVTISLASNDVSAPVDEGGEIPIGDVRRASYINTDRGYQSLTNLLCRARATLLDRARVVTIGLSVPFHHIKNVTLRKNAAIEYDMIPGGLATGKITGYSASGDGEGGQFALSLSVGCAVGHGNSVEAVTGTPDYVEEGYVETGYQTYSNQYDLLEPGDLAFLNIESTLDVDDDGINFFDMNADEILNYVIVTNGPATQKATMGVNYATRDAALQDMISKKTELCLSPKRVTGGPFETLVDVTTTDLMVPKQIDLEAAAV